MQHAMQHLSVGHDTCADACADGKIDCILKSLCTAPGCFAQKGSVNIRIKADRNPQRIGNALYHIETAPRNLGGLQNTAVGFRFTVQVNRSETCHTD